MDISLFDYKLPDGRIAYYPAPRRDGSKLLVVDRESGNFKHRKFPAVLDYMEPGDGLVVNNTMVFKSRLIARRETGGKVEIFLLGETKFGNKVCWEVLTHPTRRIKEGEKILFDDGAAFEIIAKLPTGRTMIKFKSRKDADKIIKKHGHIPLPVYIHRPDEKRDENRYQTVYAQDQKAKAVAAPTAGLHFTHSMIKRIEEKGIKIIPVTLHVGYGTFKTVKAKSIEDHSVDGEYAEISRTSANAINKIKRTGGKIFAVGTTSVRTLESAPHVKGAIQPFSGIVDLYIYPPYKFKTVDHMITNFHLPKSSLLFLVSAFATRELILKAYYEAIRENYRFYSYGDCMLIL